MKNASLPSTSKSRRWWIPVSFIVCETGQTDIRSIIHVSVSYNSIVAVYMKHILYLLYINLSTHTCIRCLYLLYIESKSKEMQFCVRSTVLIVSKVTANYSVSKAKGVLGVSGSAGIVLLNISWPDHWRLIFHPLSHIPKDRQVLNYIINSKDAVTFFEKSCMTE